MCAHVSQPSLGRPFPEVTASQHPSPLLNSHHFCSHGGIIGPDREAPRTLSKALLRTEAHQLRPRPSVFQDFARAARERRRLLAEPLVCVHFSEGLQFLSHQRRGKLPHNSVWKDSARAAQIRGVCLCVCVCLNLARAIIMAALHKLLSSTGMVYGEVRGVTPRLYPPLSWGDVSHDAFPEQLSSAAGCDQRWQEYHIWLSLAFFICAIVFHRTDIHAAVQNPSLSLIPPALPPPRRPYLGVFLHHLATAADG